VPGGFVSVEAAAKLYGVHVKDDVVDVTRTAALRRKRTAARAFHRNEYVDVLA
jgi:N-methylhydantoinase B